MALYIPTTFGASGGGTIIASGSTSISGTIGMNGGWPFQQDYFVSNSITYSYWMWQGVDAYTGTTTNRNNNVATFDIFSGSTLNARLITIGGGGGAGGAIGTWTGTGYSGNECVGGGGAGGLVEFNNFPLIPGHYNIVAGAGGANGVQGIDSSITLPIPIAQPFTSSYVVAYSGGKGGANGAKGTSGGSVGGNTQAPGNPNPVISNPVLGAGLGGRSGGDQGRTSGEIPASTPTTEFRRTATGGGGFNASSRASSAGKYITDGGSGSLMQIYPYNYNTASYMVTGGGAAGLPGNPGNISQSFTFSQQGDNTWGIGSGGSVSGSGATTIWGGGDGNYGMVYLEYPYYFNPYPKLATDGLMFRLSATSLTGSVWYDVSDNGNNALISGSNLFNIGSGWNFNGTNNYLTFPVSMSGYPVSQSFTLQWYGTKMNAGDAWYHWSGSGTLGRGDGYGDGWENYQTGSNKTLYTWVQTNFGGSGGGTVAWSRLYINDSIFWSEYDEIIPAISQPTSAPNVPWQFGYGTQLGTLYDPSRQFLSGSASDLLLYNRPLDVSEIANNYKYFQTLPNIVGNHGYRIAQCNTTESQYINYYSSASLAVNDVILMNELSSSSCFYVSQSGLPYNSSYPTVTINRTFTSCSICSASLVPIPIDYILAAGGGGGGELVSITQPFTAGGGGAGGGVYSASININSNATFSVSVGVGGAKNQSGGDSAFNGIYLYGGGGGTTTTGSNGGNGGGGSAVSGSSTAFTITYAGGTGSVGFNGAEGWVDSPLGIAGGGGGSTIGAGSTGSFQNGGNGGAGILWLDGKYYGGAGGGGYVYRIGVPSGSGGSGGSGVGGNGAALRGGSYDATAAVANRGAGGGGGAGSRSGSAGSAGIALIRYASTASLSSGGKTYYLNGYVYNEFTSSGTLTTCRDCIPTEPCRNWDINVPNTGGATITVSYINCSNVGTVITKGQNTYQRICVYPNTTPIITAINGAATLTYIGTTCT